RSDVKTIQWPSGENEALLSKLDEARSGRSPEPSPLAMYSVICDGPRRFMSSVCFVCASGASPAADTRINNRGSLVLIGNSLENRLENPAGTEIPDRFDFVRRPCRVCRLRQEPRNELRRIVGCVPTILRASILPLLSFLYLPSWLVSLFLFPRVRPSSLPARCPAAR